MSSEIVDGILQKMLEFHEDDPNCYIPTKEQWILIENATEQDVSKIIDVFLNCNRIYMRYLVPWLPGKTVTEKLVEIIQNWSEIDYSYLGWVYSHLYDSDFSGFEEIIENSILEMAKSGKLEKANSGIFQSCPTFLSSDFGNHIMQLFDGSNENLIPWIIYSSTEKNIIPRIREIAEKLSPPMVKDLFVTPLLRRFPKSELSEIMILLFELELTVASLLNPCEEILGKLVQMGTNHHLSILDILPEQFCKENQHLIANVRTILSMRENSTLGQSSIPIDLFEGWIRVAIKDSRGMTESNLRGYYMGLKEGPQPPNVRQKVLQDILQSILQTVHNSRVRDDFPHGSARWQIVKHKMQYLFGNNKFADFNKRISTVEKYIQKDPIKPWGYYAYNILNEDKWELLREYGPTVGLLPYLVCSKYGGGLVECKVIEWDSSSCDTQCCDNFLPLISENKLECANCKKILSDFNLSWKEALRNLNCENQELRINGKFEINSENEITATNAKGQTKKVSKKAYNNIRSDMKKYMTYIPKITWDHLAAMHADVEDMLGITGDSIKRWRLD